MAKITKGILIFTILLLLVSCSSYRTGEIIEKRMDAPKAGMYGSEGRWTVVIKFADGHIEPASWPDLYYGCEVGDIVGIKNWGWVSRKWETIR